MRRLTIKTGIGYSSAYSKSELAERLGIIEDVLEKTGDTAEDLRRWQEFKKMVLGDEE